MKSYRFDDNGRFIMANFARQRPIASFLPGIVGPLGIPMWVFTVNRGQAVASFGIESKDSPIMEFEPANKAYQTTPTTGFRTFLKLNGADLYEPFAPRQTTDTHHMAIGMNELELQSYNPENGLQTNVLYFNIPGENFAALARQVTVANKGKKAVTLEMLDGMPRVIPFGVTNRELKEIGHTLEAWMAVFNLDKRIPFYHLPVSAADTAVVESIKAGHFYLAFTDQDAGLLPALVDPALIFGHDTSLHAPVRFARMPLSALQTQQQITTGRTPCGFFGLQTTLEAGQTMTLYALIGHVGNLNHLHNLPTRLTTPDYFQQKRTEANDLTRTLTDASHTQSGHPVFDAYCRQTCLDNGLRGGWPQLLGAAERPLIYHIYSRKHGDLERDYNEFHIAAEPYSQGNGNYRDINQNRRCDVWFTPQIGDFNILTFLSLIQADGYNPLVVEGSRFTLNADYQPEILSLVQETEKLEPLLALPFTPGSLLRTIADHQIGLKVAPETFVTAVLSQAEQQVAAEFGDGYWTDHWLYNLDLIEDYLAIFPDKQDELLFGKTISFFDSQVKVLPRSRKYVLTPEGQIRQYGALIEDEEKAALLASRQNPKNRLRTAQGKIYQTTVFSKLLYLALNKFATLDPLGMGVEMEASKPGWYDALNGLPALFGSSLPETYELLRLLTFLRQVIAAKGQYTVHLSIEAYNFLQTMVDHLQNFQQSNHPQRDFYYWDAVSYAREAYRDSIHLGVDGRNESINLLELDEILGLFSTKVAAGLQRVNTFTDHTPPTYFYFDPVEYEILEEDAGSPQTDERGRPYVRVTRFQAVPLPLFLEGPVHAMKILPNKAAISALHQQVKASPLYDSQLKMFKVNDSLANQSFEIGRAQAFTPGWLENESIWLHMAYKYLLELLRAGLYEEFWEEAQHGLIPFLDPARYGRSPLENVSFIVSSAHPDESLHGAGFVGRLTGATAEFLSMWTVMMAGKRPFYEREGELCLQFQPALPGWLFTDEGTISYTFLGKTTVTYRNPERQNTWQMTPQQISLQPDNSPPIILAGSVISSPYARNIRDGKIREIQIDYR